MKNRPFEFRAWDGEKLVYDFTVARPQLCDVLKILTDEEFAKQTYGVKQWKVNQYSGMKDINGVKIFEMDIIQVDSSGNLMNRLVLFKNGAFSHHSSRNSPARKGNKLYSQMIFKTDVVVIGNGFENPELLPKYDPVSQK